MTPTILLLTLLSPEGPTGVHTYMRQVSRHAARFGADARVVTPFDRPRSIPRKAMSGVRRLLEPLTPEAALRWQRGWLARDLAQILQGTMRENVPHVLYAQDPLSAQVALNLRHTLPTAPRVAMIAHFNISEGHENVLAGRAKPEGFLVRALAALERQVFPHLDLIICPSEFTRQHLAARHPDTEARLRVIPNFTGSDDAAPNATCPPTDLMTIATLAPRKNQAYLLRVLHHAKARGHRYTLTLVGDGPDRRMLAELAQELGVAEQVTFMGEVLRARALLPQTRAYAHSAKYEAFGISLIEALACGKPILAAPVGGIPEVFRDGCEGRYWNLDDPQEGAAALIRLLENPDAYQMMSDNALKRYRSAFSPEAVMPNLLASLSATRMPAAPTPLPQAEEIAP